MIPFTLKGYVNAEDCNPAPPSAFLCFLPHLQPCLQRPCSPIRPQASTPSFSWNLNKPQGINWNIRLETPSNTFVYTRGDSAHKWDPTRTQVKEDKGLETCGGKAETTVVGKNGRKWRNKGCGSQAEGEGQGQGRGVVGWPKLLPGPQRTRSPWDLLWAAGTLSTTQTNPPSMGTCNLQVPCQSTIVSPWFSEGPPGLGAMLSWLSPLELTLIAKLKVSRILQDLMTPSIWYFSSLCYPQEDGGLWGAASMHTCITTEDALAWWMCPLRRPTSKEKEDTETAEKCSSHEEEPAWILLSVSSTAISLEWLSSPHLHLLSGLAT